MNKHRFHGILVVLSAMLITSCSTTSSLEEGEQLYTGLKKIEYENYQSGNHFLTTQAEVEAALACAPNGALFGSSYYRTPFPYGLWIWNAFSGKNDAVSKWLVSSFGKSPVVISEVNPELRVSVAENVLKNYGYFHGDISYDIINGKAGRTKNDSTMHPLTAKIGYKVNLGPVFRLDSISRIGFSDDELKLINTDASLLKKGDPFTIALLDQERQRIYKTFRNNGYYYYDPSYSTYLADTTSVRNKVQLKLQKIDSIPDNAKQKWVIGKRYYKIRRTVDEELTDTMSRRSMTFMYNGKRPAIRPRVILQDVQMRSGQLFSEDNYEESLYRLTTKGVFSSVDISFVPNESQHRDTTGVLDMVIDCLLDKPYSVSSELNYTQKTNGRGGPGLGVGFAKSNAFRGGEILEFNLSGSAEFNISSKTTDRQPSYNVSGDITLVMPRLLLPKGVLKRRWRYAPTTMLRAAIETKNRSGFYRRNMFSAEMLYSFQTSAQSRHTFSPIGIDYSYTASMSEKFAENLTSGYALAAIVDNFIPRMRYTYAYSSPKEYLNPVTLSVTLSEAGMLTSLGMMLAGQGGWNHKGKELFKVEYSQFYKIETEFTKKWQLTPHSSLLAHAMWGYGQHCGNSDQLSFTEAFYNGGANDLRGFSTRSFGPGSTYFDDRDISFLASNGNSKLLLNLEYRPRLFGSLYGAMFLDAGNVWQSGATDDNMKFRLNKLGNDLAVDAGVGIRYDLDFFVIRLDWGFVVHAPYDTGKRGYFNFPGMSEGQCLNFAIGYPF